MLKISDLPPQFTHIAQEIGIDNTKKLFKEFGGSSIYFPTEKTIYKEVRNREIINLYNGMNMRELCLKYQISENYIKKIIKQYN